MVRREGGDTRSRGARGNLGHQVARGPLANVRKERGLEPAPDRKTRTTWRECPEARRVGVQVRRAGGASDGGDIGRGERVAPGRPEERVAVMDEEPDVSQASVLGSGGVPHELGDPRPVGLGADARDLTAAAGQVNQDQHGEGRWCTVRPGKAGQRGVTMR